MSEPTKVCTKCGVEYPATKEFFYAQRLGKNGLTSKCKKCKGLESLQWQKNNPEKIKVSSKKTRIKNIDRIKKYMEVYRIEKSAQIKERTNEYRKKNPEKVKKWKSDSYQRTKQTCIERSNIWRHSNPEKYAYINTKRKLKKTIGATPPPELVEIKVLINKTKKLCKTLNS